MNNNEQPRDVKILLNEDSTEEDFYAAIEQVMPQDAKVGLGADAGRRIGEAIMYLTPFAPAPATFDRDAFSAVTSLEGEEMNTMVDVLKDLGIIAEENDRLKIVDQTLG